MKRTTAPYPDVIRCRVTEQHDDEGWYLHVTHHPMGERPAGSHLRVEASCRDPIFAENASVLVGRLDGQGCSPLGVMERMTRKLPCLRAAAVAADDTCWLLLRGSPWAWTFRGSPGADPAVYASAGLGYVVSIRKPELAMLRPWVRVSVDGAPPHRVMTTR